MMKRTEGVTERLLEAAKDEFLEKGYECASLRTIAKRAESSKGAIYTRYPDKAALFTAVVEPVVVDLCAMLEHAFDSFGTLPSEVQQEAAYSYADEGIIGVIDYIYAHYDEFKILISRGEGETYAAFIHRLVDLDMDTTRRFIETTGNDAISSGRLTTELMHMLSNAWYSGIFEIVAHDMPKEEAKTHIERLCRFYRAGWETIFNP